MHFEIALVQSSDGTVVAEISGLPGVLAAAVDARGALRRVLALALRVLAERSELAEVGADDLPFDLSLDAAGRLLIDASDLQAEMKEAVSSEVLEQVAAAVFGRVPNDVGGVQDAIAETPGRLPPQSRRAANVLEALMAAGWRERRRSPTFRTMRRGQGEELVFPFRDNDVLRSELLNRVEVLGRVRL